MFRRFFRAMFSFDRLIGYALLVAFLVIGFIDPYPKEFLRLKTFDFLNQQYPRAIPPLDEQPVVIIDLDEDSLAEYGQWPWPRNLIAQLMINSFQMGAGQFAFDIVFAEPDRMNPDSVIESLVGMPEEVAAKLRELPSNDSVMANVIKQAPVVLGQAAYFDDLQTEKGPPVKKSVAVKKATRDALDPTVHLPNFQSLIRNVSTLEKAAVHKLGGHGIFSLVPEPDGIVRRVPSLFVYDGNMYPSLTVEMMRVQNQKPTSLVTVNQTGIVSIGITKRWLGIKGRELIISTDKIGRVYPYFSKSDKAKYVAAKDILNGTADPNIFKWKPIADRPDLLAPKMALLGTSAVGLLDIRAIPTEPVIPGVEVHAQLIEAAWNGDWLNRPFFADIAELSVLLLGGILMIIFVPWIGAKWTVLMFAAIAGGSLGGQWYMYIEEKWLLDGVYATICILLMYSTLTYTGYAREEANRRQTRDAFSKYLSPDMVERVAQNPDELTLGGEQREMTLLFCDVRGFTTISEQFDAVGLTSLINKLLTPLTNAILKRRGTIDKYMGDCIMAFWNAPLDDDDQEYNGCESALAMLAEMEPLNARLEQEAKEEGRKHVPLRVGLGLNTGPCVVGNMGSDMRFDYSVLGDAVNLAARLEGQSKSYGMNVVLGPTTWEKVKDRLACIDLDYIQVKGKTTGTYIYGLLGDGELLKDPQFLKIQKMVNDFQNIYREQKWDEAEALIKEVQVLGNDENKPWVLEANLDVLCELYLERIAEYRENPPAADWDGVFVATTK